MRKVLVVDDNALNRRLLQNILKSEYDVLEAANGQEALALLHKKHRIISAVILDIYMPVMDGFDFLKKARDNAVLAQIPVIVATGSADVETEVKALALGANDFVTKPYNPVLILHCLRNTINLRETASIVNAIQRDKLTGLYNRETFFDKAAAMIKDRPSGFYLMSCFDIDGFKVINDQYGAVEGDRILQHIGKVCRNGFEHIGGIASRISADNFAALYPAGEREVAFVTKAREHDLLPPDMRAMLTFSVGRYLVTDLSLSTSAVYDRAFIAKQSVKGRYDAHIAYFDESMRDRLLREQQIIGEMDAALAGRQFEVWFQPQYNHATGAMIGAEALVRWRHPDKGLIAPGVFIPVFEQNGFIYELDKYVWTESCALLRQWLDDGREPVPISVNVSRYDVFRDDFLDVVEALVSRYRIPYDLLRFEITESAFSESTAQIIAIVRKLIDDGFTVEIDDFGSGYSSLNTLKDVPAQVLKLDMRFLENDENRQRGGSILESIVRMARWLGMSVIAEGVETREQADYLVSIGCNYMQGYFFARPMSAAAYDAAARKSLLEERTLAHRWVEERSGSSFWDPQSIDMLVFNTYVGGACIFEYHRGVIEMLRANKQYAQVLGGASCTTEYVLGMRWPDHMDEETAKLVYDAIERAAAHGEDTTVEATFTGLPGAIRGKTVLRTAFRLIARTDDRFLIFSASENITTERLTYEAVLPAVIDTMLAASGERAFVKDRAHRYLCCSPAYAESLSLPNPGAIIGKRDGDLVDAAFAARYEAEEDEIIASKTAKCHYEAGAAVLGDTWLCDDTSKYPLLDTTGEVFAIYCVTRDIARSREADTRLSLINESIPGGLAAYTLGPDGLEAARFTYANEGFCRFFGLERAEDGRCIFANPTSLIYAADFRILSAQHERLRLAGTPVDCVYRVRVPGGGSKWVNHKATAVHRSGDMVFVNAVLLDVTELQETAERLRLSEEEHRLVVQHTGNVICRFTVADRTLALSPEVAAMRGLPEKIADMPEGMLKLGLIAPESEAAYRAFYEGIVGGGKSGTATFRALTPNGWRWLEGHYSTIFTTAGAPVSAVISFNDVTEQQEKETVYRKWQQSLLQKNPDSYTLYRCNLSKDAPYGKPEGALLHAGSDGAESFDQQTAAYAQAYVDEEDRARYTAFLDANSLLANYYRGKRTSALEFREICKGGGVRWLRLTVDLVEYPNAEDVEAYLMYENIDDSKRAELLTLERAEKDPLTGVLNRTTFAARVDQLIQSSRAGALHAMLMLDIDGFKLVNDVFGHGAGDQTLIEVAAHMRACLRRADLLGRLGGDEFVVFLHDIPNDAIALNKALQICALVRKSFSVEVQISASIGIVICPRDGRDFATLYQRADAALYHVKGTGKDAYAFYNEDMRDEHLSVAAEQSAETGGIRLDKKRRMLIVDDNRLDFAFLDNLFKDSFLIEKARDGASALVRLRHYGTAISVVLLDLMMPGIDGFEVLARMQSSVEMRAVPVVVVSGDDDPETSLRAIRAGASDFVTKPVDADLLRIRVSSAISKAENERLRAQNSYLEMESNELAKYRTVIERTGLCLIEQDWVKGAFAYDPMIAAQIAGTWDDRKLWHILLADMVTDVATVRAIQELAHGVAEDRNKATGSMTATLKTPSGAKHRFRVDIYKRVNPYQLTDKLIFALKDLDEPPESA